MATRKDAPTTLLEAVNYFSDKRIAHKFVAALRWPDGVVTCPRCEATSVSFLSTRDVWKCLGCKKQFSLKVGTIFEDSPLSLSKWLPAMWMLVNCKNGISSYELSRAVGVTQKTAWFMLHRIRLATQAKSSHGSRNCKHLTRPRQGRGQKDNADEETQRTAGAIARGFTGEARRIHEANPPGATKRTDRRQERFRWDDPD